MKVWYILFSIFLYVNSGHLNRQLEWRRPRHQSIISIFPIYIGKKLYIGKKVHTYNLCFVQSDENNYLCQEAESAK